MRARARLVAHGPARQIVLKWGPYVQRVHRVPVRTWAERMVGTFVAADPSNFRDALQRGTFDAAVACRPRCSARRRVTCSTNAFDNPACPAGYKAVEPDRRAGTSGVYSHGAGFNGDLPTRNTSYAWQDTTTSNQSVFGGNVCCRVPGR